MNKKSFKTENEVETFELGYELAGNLRCGDIVAMYGDLGSGKTEFVKGICSRLDVDDLVSSPTFTIVNEYEGMLTDGIECSIFHIDLYRLESDNDLREIGLDEILADPDAIKIVEWSEHGRSSLAAHRVEVRFEPVQGEENTRLIDIILLSTEETETIPPQPNGGEEG